MSEACFTAADILLPTAGVPLDPWACIAVDQFTSQPEYWQRAEHLADAHMLCVAPRGMLPPALVAGGRIGLSDLAQQPLVRLAASDPIGTLVNHACREAEVSLQAPYTVQTYHAALALAHHGQACALVDACTAASAERDKVDVLAVQPPIAVPVQALRPAHRPASLLAEAMLCCMRTVVVQALAE